MPQAHSKYGASSADRWLNCPGSVKLSEIVPPQPSSVYAQEGTAAHKLGELCLMNNNNPSDYADQEITLDDGSKYFVNEDMVEAVTVYVDYVRSRAKLGELFIETQFSLAFVHDEMFGTNDACVYSDMLGMLEVIDYKHGAGIAVSPEENTQLAYYGLGAANVQDLHPDSQIKLTIFQPRAAGEPIKSWVTTVGYLDKFAKVLKKGVEACQKETTTVYLDPKHFKQEKVITGDLNRGEWCRFCPAQTICPKFIEGLQEVAKAEFKDEEIILPEPDSLKPVDIKKVLDFAPVISSWLKAVESYAFNELERGQSIDGYKLVKKRANRKWFGDEDMIVRKLRDAMGVHPGDIGIGLIYSELKLLSPAQIEKKKVDKNLVASLCETPDNGNTIVPVSDKRPEVESSARSDFDVIEG